MHESDGTPEPNQPPPRLARPPRPTQPGARSAPRRGRAPAAEALKLTAQDLRKLGVIDRVIDEPLGGAHRDGDKVIARVGDAIERELLTLRRIDPGKLRAARREKFLAMGQSGQH